MRSRPVSLILAVLLFAALVGCDTSSSEEDPQDTQSTQDSTTTQDTSTSSPDSTTPDDTASGDTTANQDAAAQDVPQDTTANNDTGGAQDTGTSQDTSSMDDGAGPMCDENKLTGGGIGREPPREGGYCDFIEICVDDAQAVFDPFPNAECQAGLGACAQVCTIRPNPIKDNHINKLCAMSLLDSVHNIACWILGP